MSGIYGIYRHDGAPVEALWLDRIRAAMANYGPQGGGCRIDGSVGMGHLLLEINPEDTFENQPEATSRGMVVNAARLDNREALLESFGVSIFEAPVVPDGRLVALAYERWGEDLCPHLQGDWALAAWDPRERRLFLARDACGNATLYYHQGPGYFAFASSLKALLALPGVAKVPDRLRLAEMLVSWQHDAELTAYEGFRRLVWAHAMTVVHNGEARQWRHWSCEGRDLLNYRRDEDYEEAFLEHYTRAVRSRLRTQKPVAATLSGGRDSGSVVALAAPILHEQGRELTAYTSTPLFPPDGAGPSQSGNEWNLAHATARIAGSNVQHVPIDAANHGVIESIEHFLDLHEGPSHAAGNQYWLQAIAETTARDGAGVLLNGALGNATVSWSGNGSAALALRQGHLGLAMRLFLKAEPGLWLTLKRQVLKPLIHPGLKAWRRLGDPSGPPWRSYSALNPKLAEELNLEARMRAGGHDPTFHFSPLRDLRPLFFAPAWGIAMGFGSELGARHGFAFLDPTIDQALVEFLLRVPDDQFRRDGQSSSLLRRAFRDRLPPPVLEGHLKGLQAADLGHRILQELPAIRNCLASLDFLPEARCCLDLPLLHSCLEELSTHVDPDSSARAGTILLRGMGVGLFLLRLGRAGGSSMTPV
jgi:asparagine synthase (glutamine-hydrolysing)